VDNVPELTETVTQLGQTLVQLVLVLVQLVAQLFSLILQSALLLAWIAWALFSIRWRKMWPTLAAGAWVPVVLLVVLAALVWSALNPVRVYPLGLPLPNFWWQLLVVGSIAGGTLFFGWLQGLLGWEPPEIVLDVPAHEALHEAGDDHHHHH
jgi:hypothetical protein